jgi:hypothetical protein
VLSSIPVINSSPLCQTMNNVELKLASDTFIPMELNPNADRDFSGHVPHVHVIVNMGIMPTTGNVEVLIYADFKEIGGDGIEASGETTLTNLFPLPPGWKVLSFSDDSVGIVDFDHNPSQSKETVSVGNGWASLMVFSGFEGSTAVGETAQVVVMFKTVFVNIIQTQNCQGS